ncbi:MAG: KaiC domain-containing protein [Methanobacteriota archaeon]
MSEEDDWFERAIRETDEESDEPPVEGAEDGSDGAEDGSDGAEDGSDGGEDGSDGAEADVDNGESGTDDPAGEPAAASGDAESADPPGGTGDETGAEAADEDPVGGAVADDADSGGDETGGVSPSGGVPADAFGDIDADAGFGSFGEDDPFGGGGAGGDADAGAGPSGGSGEPSGGDDPFGGYRGGSSPGDDDFGFAEFSGGDADPGGATDFDVDPDEYESGIDRTDIGIKGLDDMILGGIPSRSLLSVIGGAGTGKTTFALQFLNHALESGNKGIYITLEQTRESILDTATEKGWSFREHAAEDRLAVVAIDPIEMANSLASIRNDLVRLIAEFDADRLVLDSVSLLEMMYDHPAKRRSEVFGFTRSLKEAGVTTLLTSEASEETPYASRHGIVEYLTDAVFVLQYVRGSDFRETRLAVEIQKIRDANHSRETKPYDITDTGISVYDQANIF